MSPPTSTPCSSVRARATLKVDPHDASSPNKTVAARWHVAFASNDLAALEALLDDNVRWGPAEGNRVDLSHAFRGS